MGNSIACAIALLGASLAHAGVDGYVCKILQIQELGRDGRFRDYKGLFSSSIGESFSVDRSTGKVIGSPLSNANFKEVEVIDRGSKESPYKHIATSLQPRVWVQYLTVSEFELGVEKSFWGTEDGSYIYSGLCK